MAFRLNRRLRGTQIFPVVDTDDSYVVEYKLPFRDSIQVSTVARFYLNETDAERKRECAAPQVITFLLGDEERRQDFMAAARAKFAEAVRSHPLNAIE